MTTTEFSHYAPPQERTAEQGGSTVVGVGELPDKPDMVFLAVGDDMGYRHLVLTPCEAVCLASRLLGAAMCFREIM